MTAHLSALSVDRYVLDVLLPDLVGHDRRPAAFLVYLYLYGQTARTRWRPVRVSLRGIAAGTGLAKSAVQTALLRLQSRELIKTRRTNATATPVHTVLRHWRTRRE